MLALQILTWAFLGIGILLAGAVLRFAQVRKVVADVFLGIGAAALFAAGIAALVLLVVGK